MIVVLLIVAIVLVFALPAMTAGLHHRRPRRVGPTERKLRPGAWRAQEIYGDWWPEFERQFRAYVRQREREAH